MGIPEIPGIPGSHHFVKVVFAVAAVFDVVDLQHLLLTQEPGHLCTDPNKNRENPGKLVGKQGKNGKIGGKAGKWMEKNEKSAENQKKTTQENPSHSTGSNGIPELLELPGKARKNLLGEEDEWEILALNNLVERSTPNPRTRWERDPRARAGE